ncbi:MULTISPECIES: STAS domain-containing protein [unclassified Streptomyces]|uniref:STAS domain-containing protein n=1 Tax=unclassified Streptomyces TaxID=2593676 RepID=UPI0033A5246B
MILDRVHLPHARFFFIGGSPAWRAGRGDVLVLHEPTATASTAVLAASGEFDSDTVCCLCEALDCVCTTQTQRIMLDLTCVTFGDCVLLGARHRCTRLILLGPLAGPVRKVLELTGTRKLFQIEPGYSPDPTINTFRTLQ